MTTKYDILDKLKELYESKMITKFELYAYVINMINPNWTDIRIDSEVAQALKDAFDYLKIDEKITDTLIKLNLIEYDIFSKTNRIRFIKPENLDNIVKKIDKYLRENLEVIEEEIDIFGEKEKIQRYFFVGYREFVIDDVYEILDYSGMFTEYFLALETKKRSDIAILISPEILIKKTRVQVPVARPKREELLDIFKRCKDEFLIELYKELKKRYNIKSEAIEEILKSNNKIPIDVFINFLENLNVYFKISDETRYRHIIAKKPEIAQKIINELYETFDPTMVDIYLAAAIKTPKTKDMLGHNVIFLNFDKSNIGKTLLGRICGAEIFSKVSLASLLGYSSVKEVRYSVIHKKNTLVIVDELGTEKDEELYGKILDLFRSGQVSSATAGIILNVQSWSSLIFNANVVKGYLSSEEVMTQEKARALYSYLKKITDNMQGLSSRLSALNFYQFSYPRKKTNSERFAGLLSSLFSILGEKYAEVVKKNEELLDYEWTDENYNKLKEIADRMSISELKEFVKGLSENFTKLNILALRMSLIDAYMYNKISDIENNKKDISQYFAINKKDIEDLIISSLNILASYLDSKDAIISKIEQLSDRTKEFLRALTYYFSYNAIKEQEYKYIDIQKELEEKVETIGKVIKDYGGLSKLVNDFVLKSKKNIKIFRDFGIIFVRRGFIVSNSDVLKKVIEVSKEYFSVS